MSQLSEENATFKGAKRPVILLSFFLLLWVAVFYESIASAVSVWLTHEAFNHCLFVLPIALYFAYERRHAVYAVRPMFASILIVPLLALQCLWLVGVAADIALFQHIAVFAMIPCVVSMCLGWRVVRVLWFPLGFVMFAVPVGDQLVPLFQVITADLSVLFLQWSGVPVYHDGLFITIPEGVFEVAEACSGIRFFIACVVMGSIIAYVNYQSVYRRVLFVAFSIFLPILANGLRAYGTIMVGHLIDIKYASAADHLIYGWGFFAFVIMLLVLFSRVGAEAVSPLATAQGSVRHTEWSKISIWPRIAAVGVPFILALVVSLGAERGGRPVALNVSEQTSQSVDLQDFQGEWVPTFTSPHDEFLATGDSGEDYYLAVYDGGPGTELVSDANRMYDIAQWRYISAGSKEITVDGVSRTVGLLRIGASSGAKRLVVYWYYLPNLSSSNVVTIKLAQALNVLSGKGGMGAVVALSKPYYQDLEDVEEALLSVAAKNAKSLEAMVDFTVGDIAADNSVKD